jgi:hypothetical protein
MPKSFPSQGLDKFVLRLPTGMRDRIGAVARANNRSMNAEIVSRLEASLQQVESEEVPDFVSPMIIETLKKVAGFEKRLEKLERPKKKPAR